MAAKAFLCLAGLVCLAAAAAPSRLKLTPGRYNTTAGPVDDKLNVHIVAHTHDDVGWLKTVDEYYMGANNSIQNAGVQYILDSVVLQLRLNPNRKFIYVEIAFFKRWWEEQTDATKNEVRGFVNSGQLEFINAGWCMSDEASPYYVDMVDQQTLGHQFLLKEFGTAAIPHTGWQIDPFGHSAFMATLYALMGFNSWFFGRIDYQDRVLRVAEGTLEMVSQPSPSLGPQADLFTGALNGYGPIPGFDFNIGSNAAPLNDDDRLEGVNIKQRVEEFLIEVAGVAAEYRTNNVMLTMGSDFEYNNANTWYKNLDKLIHYVNMDGRVNVFYSTPSIYTKSVHDSNRTWTVKKDDFFPYADRPHSFWSGYFTSRPAVKGYVRTSSNYLQACRQLEAQVNVSATSELLWEAMGLAQHHDAVSGTEKQHVADDYARHLSEGCAECDDVINEALNKLLAGPQALPFQRCLHLNESICPITSDSGTNVVIVYYNPLAQDRNESVLLPVTTSVTIYGPKGTVVPSSVAGGQVRFTASVPAMGYATYFLLKGAEVAQDDAKPLADTTIENEFYAVSFDGASGLVKSITNKKSGVVAQTAQYWAWYNSSDGHMFDDTSQPSGAYIFRPFCRHLNISKPCVPFNVSDGPVPVVAHTTAAAQEVTQTFAPWLQQTVRLVTGEPAIEIAFSVGPIPFEDGYGHEVVSIWRTDLQTDAVFYTDSNGRDMMRRQYNYRPTWPLIVTDPVAGNYYPVDSVAYMQESSPSGRRLTVMTDRAQGGATLYNGHMELMVHRRCLHDDRRGVGEPLNETGTTGLGLVINAVHKLTLDTASKAPVQQHSVTQRLTFPLVPALAPLTSSVADFVAANTVSFTGLLNPLPANVHLLTVQDIARFQGPGKLLLRLAHLFAVDEDPVLSQPASVDLGALFKRITVSTCVEMSLTANQPLASMKRLQWQTATGPTGQATPALAGLVATLKPLEIRTFLCDYAHA
eukprot:m.150634 g.150634  ORF g.150634 m.150634 type:complete len:975 (+) comp9747_c0_seq2:15-2939(+)